MGEFITFSASQSISNDGKIINYEWDFDDGHSGKGVSIKHQYLENGTYNVKLAVTNDEGVTSSSSLKVDVTQKVDSSKYPTATPFLENKSTLATVNGPPKPTAPYTREIKGHLKYVGGNVVRAGVNVKLQEIH